MGGHPRQEYAIGLALGLTLLAIGVPNLLKAGTTLALAGAGGLALAGAVVLAITLRAWVFPPKG